MVCEVRLSATKTLILTAAGSTPASPQMGNEEEWQMRSEVKFWTGTAMLILPVIYLLARMVIEMICQFHLGDELIITVGIVIYIAIALSLMKRKDEGGS